MCFGQLSNIDVDHFIHPLSENIQFAENPPHVVLCFFILSIKARPRSHPAGGCWARIVIPQALKSSCLIKSACQGQRWSAGWRTRPWICRWYSTAQRGQHRVLGAYPPSHVDQIGVEIAQRRIVSFQSLVPDRLVQLEGAPLILVIPQEVNWRPYGLESTGK